MADRWLIEEAKFQLEKFKEGLENFNFLSDIQKGELLYNIRSINTKKFFS